MAEGMTAMDLALDLGFLQPDDVQVVLSEHLGVDLHDEVIPAVWCVEVRWILDPNGERTAPAPFYWTGHPRSFAGPGPTDGEGDYDDGVFDW